MMESRLPIGIQTFREIRENGFLYVDKTPWIERLVKGGFRYLLSRPRRFGKSLLVDTMKELFEGNEALFEGLHIHGRWDWTVQHPVLRLSFDGNFMEPGKLHQNLVRQLEEAESRAAIEPPSRDLPAELRFRRLVEMLHRSTGRQVVVLVDEYDKPVLDALVEPETAAANLNCLLGLFSVMKGCDEYVTFILLVGGSKFPLANQFSGLNNLMDVSLDRRYANICGFLERDLDEVFANELQGLGRDRIREWYKGYSWSGEPDETVYNPYDILMLFETRKFEDHWFRTGSPSFLVEMLSKRPIAPFKLERMMRSECQISNFEVNDVTHEALLFQTGYITIKEEVELYGLTRYRLGYPNREVRESLNRLLLPVVGGDASWEHELGDRLCALLGSDDFEGLEELFRCILSGVPHEWQASNPTARHDGWCASLFYCWFAAVGLNPGGVLSTDGECTAMAVERDGRIYLFEFTEVDDAPTGESMAQMIGRNYADAYRGRDCSIHLIAVEFSRRRRNIAEFEAKKMLEPDPGPLHE